MRKLLLIVLLAIPASAQFGGPMGGAGRPGAIRGGGLLPGVGGDPLWIAAGPTKPSLDLDFAGRKDLTDAVSRGTSLVTFSRSAASSPGTYVGADGLIKTAAVNTRLYSEQFANWTLASAKISSNNALSPDGKQTADRIYQQPASAGSTSHFVRGINSTGPSIARTLSVYLKYDGHRWVFLANRLLGAYFDLENATIGAVNPGSSASIEDVGDGWYRCSVTGVDQNGDYTYVRLAPTNGSIANFVGDGTSGIYAWGAQLEEGTTATPYIRTTSQALAAPRFDHDPLTGESLGLLVEEARTNLLTDSEQFDNAVWFKSGNSITANATASPDGTNTADEMVDTNGATITGLSQSSIGIQSGAQYVYSVYAKAINKDWIDLRFFAGGSGISNYFDLTNGVAGTINATSGTITSVGNGWYRISVLLTSTGTSFNAVVTPRLSNGGGTYTGDGTSSFYLWGAQLEAGAFPSSYIPTAGTSLTRAADVATVEGTDFSSWYNASEGTVYAKYRSPTVATRGIVSLDDNTANEAIALQSFYSTGTQLVVTDGGTQQANTAASIITDDAAYTGVAAYKASDFAVATAGDVAIDVAGTIPTVDRMRIGVNQGGDYLNGHIARLTYWPVRKTNDVLDLISDPVPNNDYQILVKTDNTGTSNNDQFTIPAVAGTYDVDWGDGTTSTGVSGAQTHTYPAAGQYVIRMDGITHYYTNDADDKLKLLDVQNWGNQAWTSMVNAYFGASNMIMSATDAPDLSGVTSMFRMFFEATSFNQPIGHWDVSNVTNMSTMFYIATAFNQPIGNWDVSSVTNMSFMFRTASSFNQPIDDWDVSSVTNMQFMFYQANSFNQLIGSWDVGSVTNYTGFMLGKTNLNYSTANLDAIYNGWIANELSPSESIDFGSIKYTAAGAEGKDLLERANATVAVSNAVDNGSGLVRLTTAAHGLTTGNKVFIKDIVGTTEANGLHTVTVVDATTIDLQGTTFVNAYTSGGTVRTGYGWTITDGGI